VSGACELGVCALTLSVLYMTETLGPASDWIRPHFRIHNSGSSTASLEGVEIRYYYSIDGDADQVTQCFYADADVACGNATLTFAAVVPPTPTADRYYAITFASGSVPPSSDSGKIESGFHKDPYSNYTQSNDYSWDASKTSFASHDKVTLYRNGVLLWGLPPSG
jgi:hypothetical protein